MKKSETTSFGTPTRRGHDSRKFYNLKMMGEFKSNGSNGLAKVENAIPGDAVNRIYAHDSRNMKQLPDNSVHLMVTSPPYGVGKDYDEDLSFNDYRKLLYDVWKETYRVLAYGGRACINVANLGRKPYIPLHTFIIDDCLKLGYLMRGEIIWVKTSGTGNSCAWGSWKSAKNPTLRDVHEYILVFSKGDYSRLKTGENDVTGDEFMLYTQSVWRFAPESARRVKHPAPFPIELPSRLIKLYSFKNDVVLDPFNGSGTTCVAAKKLGRRYVGYDIDETYNVICEERLNTIDAALPFSQVATKQKQLIRHLHLNTGN